MHECNDHPEMLHRTEAETTLGIPWAFYGFCVDCGKQTTPLLISQAEVEAMTAEYLGQIRSLQREVASMRKAWRVQQAAISDALFANADA